MNRQCLYMSVVISCALLSGSSALACTFASTPFETDPSLAEADDVPPASPELEVLSIQRGASPCSGGDDNSCGDLGTIRLGLLTDYDEPVGLEVVSGTDGTPQGILFTGSTPTVPFSDGAETWMLLIWTDGFDDDQEPIDFELTFVAVDQAGNRSELTAPVRIFDEGGSDCPPTDEGCSATPSVPPVGWVLALPAALTALRRRCSSFSAAEAT